mgnify:CR=1 FL=1
MQIEKLNQQLKNSPELQIFVSAHFVGEGGAAALQTLMESADESPFSIQDWLRAVRILSVWLDTRALRLPTIDEVGYVTCAADSAGPSAQLSDLPSLVAEMLEAYGCERAEKIEPEGC